MIERWIQYLMSGGDATRYQAWALTIKLVGAVCILGVLVWIIWQQRRPL